MFNPDYVRDEGRSGVYRITDPISNLRIRVRITPMSSSSHLISPSLETRAEEKVISWQEKIYRKDEYRSSKDKEGILFTYIQGQTPWKDRFERELQGVERLEPGDERCCMYIMANLCGNEQVWRFEDEHVLCKIDFDGRATLIITPDFTPGQSPDGRDGSRNGPGGGRDGSGDGRDGLRDGGDGSGDGRDGSGDGRDGLGDVTAYHVVGRSGELFVYTLQLSSPQPNEVERDKENELIEQLSRRHESSVPHGSTLSLPPSPLILLHTRVEISSTSNFSAAGIGVKWILDLPSGWSQHDPSTPLIGSTHISTASSSLTHLNHLLEFSLVYYPPHEEDMSSLPYLYFEVISMDWWGTVRTEGYTHTSLPHLPGKHHVTLPTWRPIISPQHELRRYFIGGTFDLNQITDIGRGENHDDEVLSKFALDTVSSGSLHLTFHNIFQSQLFASDKSIKFRDKTSLYEKLGGTAIQLSIARVVEAFHRAKERMIAVRNDITMSN